MAIENIKSKADLARFIEDRRGPNSVPDRYLLPELDANPDAPPAGQVVIFAIDNGAGKTSLRARFATGAVQTIVTEP